MVINNQAYFPKVCQAVVVSLKDFVKFRGGFSPALIKRMKTTHQERVLHTLYHGWLHSENTDPFPGSVAGMCQGHGADTEQVKRPQGRQAAVNRMAPLDAY